jgi:Family of unknown function (DUF5946)
VLPILLGPEHPYMIGSPACWASYGELLAAQYGASDRMQFHQLIVDTYAVQHPGTDEPRAVQSVALHLMTLHLFLEQGADPLHGPRLHKLMARRQVFQYLDPPALRGGLTHLYVPRDGGVSVVRDAVYEWSRDAWDAWSPHHSTVRRGLAELGLEPETSSL